MKQKTFSIKSSVAGDMKSMDVMLEGDLGIRNAAAIKKSLTAIEFQAENAKFHFRNVEKIDITTIQTFAALSRHLHMKGKKAESDVSFSPEICELLKNTGFTSIF